MVQWSKFPGREVVPGDIVVLEAGDAVCADGRLLECASLKTAESAPDRGEPAGGEGRGGH